MINERFAQLASQWRDETAHLSNTNDIIANRYYQEIINLGMPVVPLIINELTRHNENWYHALRRITREDPVPAEHLGNYELMKSDWLTLGLDRGWCHLPEDIWAGSISGTEDTLQISDILVRIKILEKYLSLEENEDESCQKDELQGLYEIMDAVGDVEEGLLINDDYFTEWTKQLAFSLGLIDNDNTWPVNHIDWDEAADELAESYKEIEYLDSVYWYEL